MDFQKSNTFKLQIIVPEKFNSCSKFVEYLEYFLDNNKSINEWFTYANILGRGFSSGFHPIFFPFSELCKFEFIHPILVFFFLGL
jgi:hypothetical protein